MGKFWGKISLSASGWSIIQINVRINQHVSDGYHNLTQKALSFGNLAIVSVKWNYYRIHYWYMSKDELITLSKNIYLIEKVGILKHKSIFIMHKKWVKKVIAFGNIEI